MWRIDPHGRSNKIQTTVQAGSADIIVSPDEREVRVLTCGKDGWQVAARYRWPPDLDGIVSALAGRYTEVQLAELATVLSAWFELQRQREAVVEPPPPGLAAFYKGWPIPRPKPAGWTEQAGRFLRWLIERGRLDEMRDV